MNESTADTLLSALARYQITLPDEQVAKLDQYCRLLWAWNEKLNLTRHTDYDKFASRDMVDTLQLSRLLQPGERVLDVGSGGGVPGVILAITRPDLQISLAESVGKKATVLELIVRELSVPATIYASRAEDLLNDFQFDVLVARAVGPLWKICKWFAPHWPSFGRLLAIKGPRWVEERKEARHYGLLHGVALRKAAVYPMPGTDSNSVILKLCAETAEPTAADQDEVGDA